MEIERQNIRKYLLGDLSGKLTEDDLIEDNLDGGLSSTEVELFHQNFLTSDERKGHLNLTK